MRLVVPPCKPTLTSLSETLADRRTFLRQFYADAKAAFLAFDHYLMRSEIVVRHGYSALLQGVSDKSVIKFLTILSVGLDVSPTIMALLRERAIELSIDFDRLCTHAREIFRAHKARKLAQLSPY